jgi:hypothetical protein
MNTWWIAERANFEEIALENTPGDGAKRAEEVVEIVGP